MSEWYGKLPDHWEVVSNRAVFNECRVLNTDENATLLSLSQYTGVSLKKDAAKSGMREAESKIGYQIVKKDNLVMNIMLAWNGSLAVSLYDGVISPAYAVFEIASEFNPWYFHYQLRLPQVAQYFEACSTGLIKSRLRLYPDVFKSLYCVLPPRPEQDQIVRYLDWKVSQVNRLINAKKKQIVLLQEQKRRAINAAVTKGLNPDVSMKDSGTHWLGSVPEHWAIMPSKALFREGKEIRRQDDEPAAATQRYGIMLQREYMNLENRRIVAAFSNLEQWKHVDVGDFVISLRSFQGGLELSTISACVTWHYIILKNNMQIDTSYYKYLFKSASYINALRQTSDYIRDGQDLRYSHFSKVPLPFFSKQEQAEISTYLDVQCAAIERLVASVQTEIALLQEYRTCLISDVVTGKLDVHGVAVPEFGAVEEAAEEEDVSEDDETGEVNVE